MHRKKLLVNKTKAFFSFSNQEKQVILTKPILERKCTRNSASNSIVRQN